ncbi:hypothetical protein LCE26_24185 (plasmid) [Escherichia coli]|uniref:hypothetical protein n=1 Tax=Escherichia coli TaxID=562 RepID=UPI001CCC87F5|nr:hypothetical protein [Escherichia coli]UBO49312.1 hypothetical protein LCE26_24185 [Escherichia coli]
MSTELNSGTVGGFGHMGPNDPPTMMVIAALEVREVVLTVVVMVAMIIVVVHLILHPLVSSLADTR